MRKFLKHSKKTSLMLVFLVGLSGCSGLKDNDRHALTSGAIGAAGGAVSTILLGGCMSCGVIVGGAVGAASSYAYDYFESD